jgi:hypothetical protein
MLIWGGNNGVAALNTGGRYSPSSDSWQRVSTNSAPAGRWAHAGVWTGTEMLVWGGYNGATVFGNGARYRVASNTWGPISPVAAPSPRWNFPAVWTGSELIVWGGILNPTWPFVATNTGGRYTAATDSWIRTKRARAPASRDMQQAVWTGSQMLVWSGRLDPPGAYTNTGGAYSATPASAITSLDHSSRVLKMTFLNEGGVPNVPLCKGSAAVLKGRASRVAYD